MHTHQTVIGVFTEQELANRAIDDLQRAQFSGSQVELLDPQKKEGGGLPGGLRRLFPGHEPEPGGVREDLLHFGLAEKEVEYYTNQYNVGHTLVVVQPESTEQELSAMTILRSDGGYSYPAREGQVS